MGQNTSRIEVDLLEAIDVLNLVRMELSQAGSIADKQAEMLNRLASAVSVVLTRLDVSTDHVANLVSEHRKLTNLCTSLCTAAEHSSLRMDFGAD